MVSGRGQCFLFDGKEQCFFFDVDWFRSLGRADALASAFHFSHNGWDGFRKVLVDKAAGESWLGSKESIVKGLAEGWDGWIASSSMEENGQFR